MQENLWVRDSPRRYKAVTDTDTPGYYLTSMHTAHTDLVMDYLVAFMEQCFQVWHSQSVLYQNEMKNLRKVVPSFCNLRIFILSCRFIFLPVQYFLTFRFLKRVLFLVFKPWIFLPEVDTLPWGMSEARPCCIGRYYLCLKVR